MTETQETIDKETYEVHFEEFDLGLETQGIEIFRLLMYSSVDKIIENFRILKDSRNIYMKFRSIIQYVFSDTERVFQEELEDLELEKYAEASEYFRDTLCSILQKEISPILLRESGLLA
jgi:hypothetical protein